MSTTDNPTLQVRGPAELLGAVPFLLSFHPQESLVIIGLDDTRVVVTARLDLADITDLVDLTGTSEVPNSPLLADTLGTIRRGTATSVVGAVFTEAIEPSAPVIAAQLRESANTVGLGVVDTLLVTGGRWWSLDCPDPACCPPEGTALPSTSTAFDAAATCAGLVALPNREALTNMFTQRPDRQQLADRLEQHHHDQLSAALTGTHASYDRSGVRALFAAQRAAQAGAMPTDDDVARFGVALQSYPVRDAVWLAVDEGRLPGIEVWVNLARRLPNPYDAAPLFLAAWSSYRAGNGALAGIAADLALESDPSYSAADLLIAALARGIDPRTLPKLRPASKGDPTTAATS